MEIAAKLSRISLNLQERLLGRIVHSESSAPHLAVGIAGERAALFELRRRGYVIVANRWTSARVRGDVDLIAWDGPHLCFIEVKTRTARDLTPAESAVDDQKRRTIRSLARIYLRTFPASQRRGIPVRFDVVSVYSLAAETEFDVFPGTFGWS